MPRKEIICLACIAALMLAYIPAVSAQDAPVVSPLTVGESKPVLTPLRVGFENTKPLNNLDVYGNKAVNVLGIAGDKSLYNIEDYSNIKPVFNASQRAGQRSTFAYNWGQTKPVYSIGYNGASTYGVSASQTTNAKSLSGYPTVMLPPMV